MMMFHILADGLEANKVLIVKNIIPLKGIQKWRRRMNGIPTDTPRENKASEIHGTA